MKFYEVALVFDSIEKENSRNTITQLLANLFKKATPTEASMISYLSLGELNPVYIGTKFNIAEKTIIKVIANLLDLSASTISVHSKKEGDLGNVVANSEWRAHSKDDITLREVHSYLKKLLEISGTGAQEIKEKAVWDLLKLLDPLSAKYIVRIILGKLRLGFSDMTLLDAFSYMEAGDKSLSDTLEEAYNISADIGLIIKVLKEDGLEGIKKMHIIPGIPIRPAAAERMNDPQSIVKKLGQCVAQPKLDGFRLQVHFFHHNNKKEVRFFSRNLQDMSNMFPDLKKTVLSLDLDNIIFEGEAIAYDPETGSFLPFQETVKRKRKYEVEEFAKEYPLKIFIFDLLYLNDRSLLSQPNYERRKKLISALKGQSKAQQVINVIEEKEITTSKELEEYFNESISSGLEGVVVKKIDSPYQAGKRNFNWIKLKRHETGQLEDTIDCVVLGYYVGHGRRSAFGIGSFLVGIYNPKNDAYETIAKIGTGLTDEGWATLKKKCDKEKIDKRLYNVECAKELIPDVWVAPSIVCAIRADEITLSPVHSAGSHIHNLGFALRFPRFISYRDDKSPSEVTTIDEVEKLYKMQFHEKVKRTQKAKKPS